MSDMKNAPKRAEAEESAVAAKGGVKLFAVVLAALVLLLAGGYVFSCTRVTEDTILPKTAVNGVEVSGLSTEEAAQLLAQEFVSTYSDKELKVRVDGEEYGVKMGDTLFLDVEKAAGEALEPNQRPLLLRGVALLRAYTIGCNKTITPVIDDTEQLDENIEKSGLRAINTTVQTDYKVGEKGDLEVHMGVTGHSVDEEALNEAIYAAVAANDYETVIECPMVTGEVKPLDWDKLEQELCREPSDATLLLSDDRRSYELVESVTGVSFDVEGAKKQVEEAEEGTLVTVALSYEEPEITTEKMKENLFADTLADYETVVKGSDDRRSNVRLACQKCDGIILLPGDSIGYNETLGERTAENGFFAAPAYLNGETVMEYGGGICQVSSTIYCATLYANLQIDERHNHTFASSYVPLGMDATVSWEGPDFVFTNNQKYPIKLEVTYWDGKCCVTIRGTKLNSNQVKIDSDVLETQGYSTKTIQDSSRFEGETYIDQHGVDGALVQTYRVILDGDGKELSREKEAFSDYTPEPEIILVGTKKKEKKKDKKKDKNKDKTQTQTQTPAQTPTQTETAPAA